MRYCLTHERGEMPQSYDVRYRRQIPAYWRPLRAWTVVYAFAWARAFGCAGEITVEETPCDYCAAASATCTMEVLG